MSRQFDRASPWLDLSWTSVLLYCAFISLTAMLLHGYTFGAPEHGAQLPMIHRMLSPEFAPQDYFVNASENFGPRTYYKAIVAWLAAQVSLSFVAFVVNWLYNLAVAIVTCGAGRLLFRSGPLPGLIACAMAMTLYSVEPGRGTRLVSNVLQPANVALGPALCALLLGLLNRPFWAMSIAAATTLIHPLIGAEVGGLALVAVCVTLVYRPPLERSHRKTILALIGGLAVFIVTVALAWLRHYGSTRSLPPDEFIRIYGYFRAPHHFVPSTWGLRTHVFAGAFFVSTLWAWWVWTRNGSARRDISARIFAVLIVTAGLLAGGYLFVEIWPSRYWTTANTWRLFVVIRWMGFLLFAKVASDLLETSGRMTISNWLPAFVLIAGGGRGQALFPVLALGLREMVARLSAKASESVVPLIFVVAGLVTVVLVLRFGNFAEAVQMMVFLAMATWLLSVRRPLVRFAIPALALVCTLGMSLIHITAENSLTRTVFGVRNVNFTFGQLDLPYSAAAGFARDNTPQDAMFVVPPGAGLFRMLAERSLVVDFTSFPFQDWGMKEWDTRMRFVYGSTKLKGHAARDEMDRAYRSISDDQLRAVQERYGATHALLYAGTETALPVRYADHRFKVVVIDPRDSTDGDTRNE